MAKQARSTKKMKPRHRAVKPRRRAPAVIPVGRRFERRFYRGRAVHVDAIPVSLLSRVDG